MDQPSKRELELACLWEETDPLSVPSSSEAHGGIPLGVGQLGRAYS